MNMWKDYCQRGADMPKNEVEAISMFFYEILVLIDKCIHFGILHFTDEGSTADGSCLIDRISIVMVLLFQVHEHRYIYLLSHFHLKSIIKSN